MASLPVISAVSSVLRCSSITVAMAIIFYPPWALMAAAFHARALCLSRLLATSLQLLANCLRPSSPLLLSLASNLQHFRNLLFILPFVAETVRAVFARFDFLL